MVSKPQNLGGLVQELLDSGLVFDDCLCEAERQLNRLENNTGIRQLEDGIPAIVAAFSNRVRNIQANNGDLSPEASRLINDLDGAIRRVSPDNIRLTIIEVRDLINRHLRKQRIDPSSRKLKDSGIDLRGPVPDEYLQPVCEASDSLESRLVDLLGGNDTMFIMDCLNRQQPRQVSRYGLDLPPRQQKDFFEIMVTYYPCDLFYAELFGQAALATEDYDAMQRALPLVMTENVQEERRFLTTASRLAVKLDQRDTMRVIMTRLAKYYYDTYCFAAYVDLAILLDDTETQKKAFTIAGKNLNDPYFRRFYAKLARKLEYKNRMYEALELLEADLEDRRSLIQYTIMAINLRDGEAMSRALAEVSKYPDDRWLAGAYAKIALIFNEWEHLVRAQIALRRHIEDSRSRLLHDDIEARIHSILNHRRGGSATGTDGYL